MLSMRKALILLSVVILLSACGSKRLPDGIIDHDRMVPLLVDIYLTEAYFGVETSYNFDSLSPDMVRAYNDLLARHGVTPDELDASVDYYAHHPELYNAIHHEVKAIIEGEEKTDAVETTPVRIIQSRIEQLDSIPD